MSGTLAIISPSIHLSVMLRYRDHTGWNSSKNNFTFRSLTLWIYSKGNAPKILTKLGWGKEKVAFGIAYKSSKTRQKRTKVTTEVPTGSHICTFDWCKVNNLGWPLSEIQGHRYHKCRKTDKMCLWWRRLSIMIKYVVILRSESNYTYTADWPAFTVCRDQYIMDVHQRIYLKGSTLLQNFGRNRGTASKTCYLFR